jgi:hypothetical protein
VPVYVAGSFPIGDKTFTKGTVLFLPALQAHLFLNRNTIDVSGKAAWLAFDIGACFIGIGEAKILLSAGNWVRKSIVTADLIGSSAGIAVQLLNEDAIPRELRMKIQIASLMLSLPQIGLSVPRLNRLVTEIDEVINLHRGINTTSANRIVSTLTSAKTTLGAANNLAGLDLAKILKNPDFKKVYDDLINGTMPRRFISELSLEEEAVYKFYTNTSYYKFNQALISNSRADDVLEIEKLLNQTLEKLPSSPGTRYRGIGKTEIEELKKLKIGDIKTYENFLSSSDDGTISARFIRSNITKTGEGALLIVQSKNEKDIKIFSDASKEAEFLHKSKSKFVLEEVLENRVVNSEEVFVDQTSPIYGTIFKIREI